MSEGYQRRPEERREFPWVPVICLALAIAVGMAAQYASDKQLMDGNRILQENKRLAAENTELTRQLDFHTCRVQFEPMPVPEQTNQTPTLIEEPVPLTEEEFSDLQDGLRNRNYADHPSIEEEIADAIRMPTGVYGSPVQDLRAEWMTAYHRGQKIKHAECDHCEACGITEEKAKEQGGELNDHHVVSVKRIFTEGLDPALIGDPKNFIRLCRNCGGECHFRIGHDPDGPSGPRKPTWSESNPNVRRDAAKKLKSKTTVVP